MDWPFIALAVLFVCIYFAVRLWRSREFLSYGPGEFRSVVGIQREGGIFLFNLALINGSSEDVWAEECEIVLSDFDGTPSIGFEATGRGLLRVRELVGAGQTLPVGLSQTVYDAAGRPQDEYRFVISGTLKYRIENLSYSQAFRSRRVKMYNLDPIEVRRTQRTGRNSVDDRAIALELVKR